MPPQGPQGARDAPGSDGAEAPTDAPDAPASPGSALARVAIVGCGAIGGHLARTLVEWPTVGRILLHDAVADRAEALAAAVGRAEAAGSIEAVTEAADVVVEAAAQDAVGPVGRHALARGRTLLLLSVGALADADLAIELEALAEEHGGRILIPSGAVGGLDALSAAREAGLERVKLTTTKPPGGLGLPRDEVAEPRTVFKGPARRAVEEWPANVNVAAALSLAGLGFDATEVEIVADPGAEGNRHEVRAEGAFGRFTFTVENAPFPENPKSSFLAALSAVAALRRLDAAMRVGT